MLHIWLSVKGKINVEKGKKNNNKKKNRYRIKIEVSAPSSECQKYISF